MVFNTTINNIVFISILFFVRSTQQQCPSNWLPIGSYCYYIKIVDIPMTGFYDASSRCALMNSSLANFQNQTEYLLFKNNWMAYNPNLEGYGFHINLYSYDGSTLTWADTGSPLIYNDLPTTSNTDSCVGCAFKLNQPDTWFYCSCNIGRASLVCQTLRADIPQPCYQIYTSAKQQAPIYRLTFDSQYAVQSPYILKPQYGNFYGLSSYVDGFTDAVYELWLPGQTLQTVYAYGNTSLYQLLAANYILRKVAFYFPATNLTGYESLSYYVTKGYPLISNSLLEIYSQMVISTTTYGFNATSIWAYQNTSAGCSYISRDCTYTDWSSWSMCSVTCGIGMQTSKRTMLAVAVGRNCSSNVTSMSQVCNTSCDMMAEAGIDVALADPLSLTTTVQQSIPYMLSSMTVAEQMSLGCQLNASIKTCIYDGKYCQMNRDFETIYNPNLGNCFTFNYPVQPLYYVERPGELHGLTLLLYSSQSDYLCSSYQAGFRVTIHNSSVYPFPDNMGFNVAPGYTTSLYIMQQESVTLGRPYGNCISNEAQSDRYFYPGFYSTEGCFRSCYQKQVVSTCSCGDPRYPLPDGKSYCGIANRQCVDSVSNCAADFDWSSCNCLQPCDEISYDQTITRAQIFNSPFIISYCARQVNTTLDDCINYAKRNFAILKISFEALNTLYYEEQPNYSVWRFLSDFSGVTGLLLGVCVITIPELFILFVMCCTAISVGERKQK